MKCYKIRGIDKNVCCVEQKLAYNIAFHCHISYGDLYRNANTEIQRNELLIEMRDTHIKRLEELKSNKKYNPDALFVALNNGLRKYIEHPFIAFDYECIGKAFAIPYGIS